MQDEVSSGSGFFGRYFAGLPKGLPTLFTSELWERFCFYGARALLVFALTSQYEFSEAEAGKVYGVYTAFVYATAILGGWVADRVLGFRRSILVGGLIMAAGEFLLFVPSQQVFFYGLALIITGNGLFKPNISSIVGKLYAPGDKKRDQGFVIFYQGINLGAFIAPLICGWLGERIDFRVGFLAAGIGMLIGVFTFWRGLSKLEDVGLPPAGREGSASIIQVVIGAAALSGAVFFLLREDEAMLYVLSILFGTVMLILLAAAFRRGKVERDRLIGLLILLFANAFFWALFEQAGSSLNFFAKNWTDRVVFGWEVPASWFQSINAVAIVTLAPVFVWLWRWLDRKNMDPSIPIKFGMGIVPLGLGFGALLLGISLTGEGQKTHLIWITALYVLHTCGELCLSPVGLSAVTKLAPPSMAGMVMGAWFLSIAVGNFAAGQVAAMVGSGESGEGIATAQGYVDVYGPAMWASFGVGAFFLLIGPLVNKLLHGVR